jgi:hypothetical protein
VQLNRNMVISGFTRKVGWGSLLAGLMTAMSGCTATATVNGGGGGIPSSCGEDQTVVGCTGSSVGYSCTGSSAPDDGDSSLNCSFGTAGASGETLYCCIPLASVGTGCSSDSSITTCGGSSFGFTCDAGAPRPDQTDTSLVCSTGVAASGGGTSYCCANYVASSSATCASDTTVSCSSGIGFTCTGSDTPDQGNASLQCSTGTAAANGTEYCCQTGSAMTTTPTTGCAVDGSVSCPGSTGYTCSGGSTPDATLACGSGTANGSATSYCCNPNSTTTSACAADTTVTCDSGSGYTCTGNAVPDSTLSCGSGTANGSATSYCCNAATASNGCMPDSTVAGCPSGSDGYSCTGGVSPETSTLLCGTAMAAANGVSDYCCTVNQ